MKKIYAIIIISLLTVFAFSSTACSQFKPVQYNSYDYFSVATTVLIYQKGEDKRKEIFEEINVALKEIDECLNALNENSDIYKINNSTGGEIQINQITYNVLECALEMYNLTDGAFNIASASLVDLWGFSARDRNGVAQMPYDREQGELPDDEYIQAFKRLADKLSDCSISEREGNYYFNKSNAREEVNGESYFLTIDLGGIGKGYAVDKIADILSAYSIENGYINIGGSSIKVLKNYKNADEKWDVGIINPLDKDNNYASVALANSNISTSGNYQNYFELDGVRYCHIIDPYTGKPIQSGIISTSVFGLNAMQSDALSTAVCVVGADKGKELIEKFNAKGNIVFVSDNGVKYISNESSFKLIDKGYLKGEW